MSAGEYPPVAVADEFNLWVFCECINLIHSAIPAQMDIGGYESAVQLL